MSADPPVTLADDFASFTVRDATASRPTILLEAVGTGVHATLELTASGSFDLARLLRSASVRVVAEHSTLLGDPNDLEGD